jgi:hypothetical protein
LKVPAKQPKRGRLWLTDRSCIRLRAEYRNHVWSYDFVEDRTHDGRKFRMLNIVDEFTHECLAIRVSRKLKSIDVIDVLSDLFILSGVPGHIHSEFCMMNVGSWRDSELTPGVLDGGFRRKIGLRQVVQRGVCQVSPGSELPNTETDRQAVRARSSRSSWASPPRCRRASGRRPA